MSEKIYDVPADWTKRALIDDAKYREMYARSVSDPNGFWADEAKRMVAQFRATHDLCAGDPAFIDLLERLRQGCPEFAPWWEAHDVGSITAGRERLSHPKKGSLRFEYATFQANDDPALKLGIYTPV